MPKFKIGVPSESVVMPSEKDGVLECRTPEGVDDLMVIESPVGQQIGVSLKADGDMEVGTWNADGEWYVLWLMASNAFGQPYTADLTACRDSILDGLDS